MFKKGDIVEWNSFGTEKNPSRAFLENHEAITMEIGDKATVIRVDNYRDDMDVFIWKARETATGFGRKVWRKVDVQEG